MSHIETVTPIRPGKTDSIYFEVSIVLGVFVLAIFISTRKFYLINIGKYREMGKLCRNTFENIEKQTLFADPPFK